MSVDPAVVFFAALSGLTFDEAAKVMAEVSGTDEDEPGGP